MNLEDVEGWDDWTRESGLGVVLLALAPVVAIGLVAWAIARALGLGTP